MSLESQERGLMKIRLDKISELREKGINPYPYKWESKDNIEALRKEYDHIKAEEETEHIASLAGRMVAKRRQGKAGFAHIQDMGFRMQLYLRLDILGEDQYYLYKKADIGDYVGVVGKVFKTRTGELSILVSELTILSKSLRPLPEKFHGLKDVETRYRKRYLDLLSNPESMEVFVKRSRIISELRNFLAKEEFIEVETPLLQTIPGGADARPFVTHHNTLDMDLFLRIAPELFLKRLIIGGFNKVYDMNRNFRNEGMDRNHNPEFTMLETYAAYWDYNDVMDFTERLIKYVTESVFGKDHKIIRDGKEFTFTFPFKRLCMIDAVNEAASIDIDSMEGSQLIDMVSKLGKERPVSRGKAIEKLFEHFVEPNIFEPTFVIDFPKESSPLTKDHRSKKDCVERFELFMAGMELANAYSELNDPVEQKNRFEMQENFRQKGDDEAQRLDEDFIEALEYGMPPTGGLGIGIDRLVMILTNQNTLRDVILFPTMRREKE